jgi:hypothetical protein
MNYSSLRREVGGTVRLAMVVIGLGAAASAGCGLISSDVTNFDLTLPDKRFTIDMSGWQVDTNAADEYLMRPCASNPGLCNTAVQTVCSMNCSGACGGETCELSLDISGRQPVDLVMEKPELKSINDEPVIKVTIDSVTYDVTTNTLNVDTPEITVYVAPTSVIKSNDPLAKAIGTIPPIPAGTTTTSSQSVRFTPTGRADLMAAMSSFKTPFNVLVGSSIVITASQPVPTGKLDAVVHIKGHAGL